jgi:hypothetical protein
VRTRLLLGAAGVAAGLYGAWRLLRLGSDTLLDALLFLAGGVVVHDAVVAPLTVALTVLGTRLLPRAARRQVTVGVVVLLTVTAGALPALLRLGARPDNPTLLDRNYLAGWLVLAALVLLATVAAGPLLRRTRRTPAAGGD